MTHGKEQKVVCATLAPSVAAPDRGGRWHRPPRSGISARVVLQIFEFYVPSAQETWVLFYAYAGWLPYELLDFCQCICGCEAISIGMLARAIVTELNGNRHVRGSSLFARVDLRHALHHAAREVHGGGAPNALQRRGEGRELRAWALLASRSIQATSTINR